MEQVIQSEEVLKLFSELQSVGQYKVIEKVTDNELLKTGCLKGNDVSFFRINQLSYNEDYPHREAFENVLQAIDNEAFNFVYILTGKKTGIELCLGVVKNQNENKEILGKKLSATDYGKIVQNMFEGNFNGSRIEKLKGEELKEMFSKRTEKYKNAGTIVGIPSINEKETGEKNDFQGIDRLINSMLGLEWRLVVVCEPVSKENIMQIRSQVYALYNRLSLYAKQTLQKSVSDGRTISYSENQSKTEGEGVSYTKGTSRSKTDGENTSYSSLSTTKGENESNSESSNHSTTNGENWGANINTNTSGSISVECANKYAQELMQYIDEELLKRLKVGFSKGLFKTSVYYMAEEPTHANRLKVGILSLFQGKNSSYSPLYARQLDLNEENNENILKIYQNQYDDKLNFSAEVLSLLGWARKGNKVGINTYLTTEEISLFAGLPQKEVPGISLREGVEFGLNERKFDEEKGIRLGVMVQKERRLENIPFYLSKDCMTKHTFIAGVTGSGKTTTCHKLLAESNIPFLVIEPAKTEYRTLINSDYCGDVVVFTLGNENIAPFRINPFELIEGENISSHVDMIKATFTTAFPMEASMPQLLEEAIYKCYEERGWNVTTNTNEKYETPFDGESACFPTLSDLLEELKIVVEKKGFSDRLKSDYIGSLVSRLSNLTVGAKGNMLNCMCYPAN